MASTVIQSPQTSTGLLPPQPALQGASPAQLYRAAVAKRAETYDQLRLLVTRRGQLADQVVSARSEIERKGIEQRLVDTDARIAELDKQMSTLDAEVATTAGIPGAVVPPPPRPPRDGPPESVLILSVVMTFVLLVPVVMAYARRLWRRGAAAVSTLPRELMDRLTRLEESVDSVAVEVERIGEGQRFVTNLFAQLPRVLGEGAAGPVPVRPYERPEQERRE